MHAQVNNATARVQTKKAPSAIPQGKHIYAIIIFPFFVLYSVAPQIISDFSTFIECVQAWFFVEAQSPFLTPSPHRPTTKNSNDNDHFLLFFSSFRFVLFVIHIRIPKSGFIPLNRHEPQTKCAPQSRQKKKQQINQNQNQTKHPVRPNRSLSDQRWRGRSSGSG